MATFEFDLLVSGLDLDATEAAVEALEARTDDLTFAERDSSVIVAVERTAGSLSRGPGPRYTAYEEELWD